MLDASAQPVQFPGDPGVSVAESFLHFGESRPLGMASADLVVEDLLATCLLKRRSAVRLELLLVLVTASTRQIQVTAHPKDPLACSIVRFLMGPL